MTATSTGASALKAVLPLWHEQLQSWAQNGRLLAAAQEALMLQGTPKRLEQLIDQWATGNFRNIPEIVLLPNGDIGGAMGAYAISTRKIYLNQDWLQGASIEQVISVLTEELGHHLDGELNDADTPGDEGEYMSRLLGGQTLDSPTTAKLRNQKDESGILVESQTLEAEKASTNAIRGNSLYAVAAGPTWTQAEANAVILGGHLATINDQEENNFIVSTFSDKTGEYQGLWIGLTDSTQEGNFYWSSGEGSTYRNFFSSEPNGGINENFVHLWSSNPWGYPIGSWNDISDHPDGGNADPSGKAKYFNGIIEIPLTLSISRQGEVKEGTGTFTTSINLSAGTATSGNLAEGAQIWWRITGITQDDLGAGSAGLTGTGTITNGKLDLVHSLIQDADIGEPFEVSVFSDALMTQQIGANNSADISEATPLIRSNSLYTIVDGPTWTQAEANAVIRGGNLVTVNDHAENSWIHSMLDIGDRSVPKWIGLLRDPSGIDGWKWASGESSAYRNWYVVDSEPSGDGNHAEMYFQDPYSGGDPRGYWNDENEFKYMNSGQTGIAEIPLTLTISRSGPRKEGAGLFTTSINLSAGTETSGNLAEGAQVWWQITGITQDDLTSGELSGTGFITNGKLDIQHSLVVDADTGEKFEASVYSQDPRVFQSDQLDLITNGDFETDTISATGRRDQFTPIGWTRDYGSGVDVWGEQYPDFGIYYKGAGQFAELDGGNNTSISQDITTDPGREFTLSFQWAPWLLDAPIIPDPSNFYGTDAFEVLVDGNIAFLYSGSSEVQPAGWRSGEFKFQAVSDKTRITFRASGASDSHGAYIDNISVKGSDKAWTALIGEKSSADIEEDSPSAIDNLIITSSGSGTLNGTPFTDTYAFNLDIGNDTIRLGESFVHPALSPTPLQLMTIDAGGDDDTFYGNSNDNILILTGTNQGTLDGIAFSNVENIYLLGGDDKVYIRPGGRLTGTLNGGTEFDLPDGVEDPKPDNGSGGGGGSGGGDFQFNGGSRTVEGGLNSFYLNDDPNILDLTGPGAGVIDGTNFVNFAAIDMRGGNDTANIAAAGSLIKVLDGGADRDTLNLNDAANTMSLAGNLTGTIKSATGPLTSIANFEVFNLAAGSDTAIVDLNQITAASATARQSVTIDGGTDSGANTSIDTLELTLTDADITALKTNGTLQALLDYLANPTGLTYTAALANLDLTLTGFESATLGNAIDLGQGTPGSITASGALQEGVTLTAPSVTGDPNGDAAWTSAAASPSYQWLFNGVAISDATAATYTVPPNAIAAADTAAQYSVQIIYTDAGDYRNTDEPISSAAVTVNKINNTPVGTLSAITGNGALQEGVTLTAGTISADTDGNASITGYKWFRNGVAIDTAIAATYLVPPGGSGSYSVQVSYTDGQGYSATVDSATQPVSAPPPPGGIKTYMGDYDYTITGTPTSGRVLATQKVKVGKKTSTVTKIDETFANVQTVDITAGASANIINAQSWSGNTIQKGEGGNDSLTGGAGINTYTGGLGADRFRFTLKPEFTAELADHITDFSATQKDKIEISRSAFGIGKTAKVSISSVNGSTARDAALAQASLLVYDSSTGELWWNQNGSTAGAGSGGVFAILDNQPASLAASAIALIA